MEQTLARDLAAWARETKRPDGTTVFDDPLTLERIGRIAVDEAIFGRPGPADALAGADGRAPPGRGRHAEAVLGGKRPAALQRHPRHPRRRRRAGPGRSGHPVRRKI